MLQASYHSDKPPTGTAQAEPNRKWGRLVGALLLMVVAGAAVWNVMADSAVVASVSMREQITVAEVTAKEGIKIGDIVSLQNGWDSWQGGFLDTIDGECIKTKYCLSTAADTDREPNSGRWKIESSSQTPKPEGSPLKRGDVVHLKSLYRGDGGYLDVYKKGCVGASSHCVSTSDSKNRDRGSGMWQIVADEWVTDITSFTQVRLFNIFNGGNGGYLDVNGNRCFGQLHCVVSSEGPTRHGGSTFWRFVANPAQ